VVPIGGSSVLLKKCDFVRPDRGLSLMARLVSDHQRQPIHIPNETDHGDGDHAKAKTASIHFR